MYLEGFISKQSLHSVWGSNSQPQDKDSHIPPMSQPGAPKYSFEKSWRDSNVLYQSRYKVPIINFYVNFKKCWESGATDPMLEMYRKIS